MRECVCQQGPHTPRADIDVAQSEVSEHPVRGTSVAFDFLKVRTPLNKMRPQSAKCTRILHSSILPHQKDDAVDTCEAKKEGIWIYAI
jgi:hypothetical protein